MIINYITPFSVTKDIGKEYNERISDLPDGSWIVLRDGDTMFLRPDWGKQIADIIKANGSKYKLISCVTNRLRGSHQLFKNTFSENGDISYHVEVANHLHHSYYDEVQSTTTVAGLCLIFNKDTWREFKFRENSLRFDTEFCNDIRLKYGVSIGIAKGLYLFHLYRWGEKNPTEYVKHLI